MAEMKVCPSGHYYDASRYSECPYCKPGGNAAGFSGHTGGVSPDMNSTTPLINNSPRMEKTMRLDQRESGVEPVVGWLVCIKGADEGRDYRLHAGNNFVGRSPDMDVAIRSDPTVSGSNHFCISYDRRYDKFYIAMGTGKEIVYVNDRPLAGGPQDLRKGDQIEVGRTTLLFVPLCGYMYQWTWKD